jgi:chromosome segregation ATPase
MKALSEKITESIESLRRIAPSSSAEVARIQLNAADALQELDFLYESTGRRCDDWETEARNARRQRDEVRFEVERLKTELERKLDWEEQARKLYEERDSLAVKIKQWKFDYDYLSKQCSREVEKTRKDRDAIAVAWKQDQAELKKMQKSCPEPSRLDVAAMILQWLLANPSTEGSLIHHYRALDQADALIAAAKEVTK